MYYATGARSGIPHNCCIDLDLAYHHFLYKLSNGKEELSGCPVLGFGSDPWAREGLGLATELSSAAPSCRVWEKKTVSSRGN